MFGLGTKIIILASSKKKGTGPRKGSVGYASTCSNRGTFDQYGLVATVNEVFFNRYGFESRERMEKKAIVSVFPIIKPDQGDIEVQVRSLIKRINSPKSKSVWDDVRAYFDLVPRVPITLAAPLNCQRTTLPDVSDHEFIAWMESHLLDNNFVSWLNESMTTNHHINSRMPSLNGESIEMLRQMAMDRGYKQVRLSDMTHDRHTKESTVTMMQALLAMAGRQERQGQVGYLNHIAHGEIPSGKKLPSYTVVGPLTTYLYFPDICKAFVDILKSIGHVSALGIMEDIEHTKSAIMVLSSHLWRAGLTSGKEASKV